MPKILLPHKSGRHRIAAVALFRALLTQCREVPAIEQTQRDELQNVVRNRFKQARFEKSGIRLRHNFEAGYEAIDHLDAAVAGDETSRSYILDLLQRAPERVKQPPPVWLPRRLRDKIEKQRRREQREATEGLPKPSFHLFQRPVSKERLSGRRHVPILVSANGIPFLRIKKPQPQELSRYIAQRIRIRQKRMDARWRLEAEIEVGELEDRWDNIVSQYVESQESTQGVNGGLWSWPARFALREVRQRIENERRKNQAMAEKMQAVVDRERELYEKEKAERAREKRRAYRRRRQSREEVNTAHVEQQAGSGAEDGESAQPQNSPNQPV